VVYVIKSSPKTRVQRAAGQQFSTVPRVTAEPWSRRLSVPWNVPTSYYEDRWRVLTELDSSDLLHARRVMEDRIAMRLGDPYLVVSFSDSYFDAAILAPDVDEARLRRALEVLFETIKPKALSSPIFDFQWLYEIDQDYGAARRTTVASVLGEDVGETAVDWSMNVHGTTVEPAGQYDTEYGIVSASEAPRRLARSISNTVGQADPDIPPAVWPESLMPPVAWFFDARFKPADRLEPSVDALYEAWEASLKPISAIQKSIARTFGVADRDE
jgi:hypothetical protein